MKIAYITTSFGVLTHTFIRKEVFELRRLGMDIALFGIRPVIASELSEEELTLAKETRYLYPLNVIGLIYAIGWFMIFKPASYFKTLSLALYTFFSAITSEPIDLYGHLKLIYHFLISPVLALRMREKNIEHIHAHFANIAASMALYCSSLLSVTFSITIHSAPVSPYSGNTGIKTKLEKAKFICSVSNYNIAFINKFYPCMRKCHLIRCGIDIDKSEIERICVLQQSGSRVRLISIGRFVEKKGFRYLIEAAGLLKKEKIEFELLMIGSGELRSSLEALAERHGLGDKVFFKGSLPPLKVRDELYRHDILIAPSVETEEGEREGIPFVIMEAMAIGIPVIATDHSGIPELVKDKITGILVPEKDPMAIAKAVKVMKNDIGLRKSCVLNAAKLLEEEFDIHKTSKMMQKLLYSL